MIRVRALHKSYGSLPAVDGVSFDVDAGEVVGFLGPNGAGKSTTMRILCGYLAADSGTVEVNGAPMRPELRAPKRSIGYLPESTPLYGRMRVRDMLDFLGRVRALPRKRRRARVAEIASVCGLEGWESRRIKTLSKGYRQRVGLAAALFGDPPVLVLDEPTSGLDPSEVMRMRALICELGRTKTVLLSTHVLSEVQAVCARVVILARGRVVADGSPSDLASKQSELLRLRVLAGEADRERLAERLLRLEGVKSVHGAGRDEAGVLGFSLAVEQRRETALRVAACVQERGLGLVELAHEVPSLERVFLRCCEPTASVESIASESVCKKGRPAEDHEVRP